jgi:hypothetical protein
VDIYHQPSNGVYIDQNCVRKEPPSFEPRIQTRREWQLTGGQIRSFYENGFLGPITLWTPEEMKEIRAKVEGPLHTPSQVYPGKDTRTGIGRRQNSGRLFQRRRSWNASRNFSDRLVGMATRRDSSQRWRRGIAGADAWNGERRTRLAKNPTFRDGLR